MTRNATRAITAARQGRTDLLAPIQGNATIEVQAPASVLFSTLTDLIGWPEFIPGVTSVRSDDDAPIAVGTRFRWRNSGFPISSTIQRLQPDAELTWTGRSLWLTAVHRNTIEPLPDGGCRLTSSESMAGFAVTRMMTSGALTGQLEELVAAVAREAERRAAAQS